jgi:hypothetical protein
MILWAFFIYGQCFKRTMIRGSSISATQSTTHGTFAREAALLAAWLSAMLVDGKIADFVDDEQARLAHDMTVKGKTLAAEEHR